MIVVLAQTGAVTGAWGYVWAAYGITWLFFGGYAATLYMRFREDV